MNIIAKWGMYLAIPQVVLGSLAYFLMDIRGFSTSINLGFAFFVAGVVAAVYVVLAVIGNKLVGIAVAMASLALIIAAFCATAGALTVAFFPAFLGCALLKFAHMIVKMG